MDIKHGKKVFIRNVNKDEVWLQNLIYENPTILGLGNLIVVSREKSQASGGRLDFLLKDPEDNSMYEVEVMLGDTDPSHIIRSIEYWDNEKRKYPLRQHFSVLVAESFERRYFNVIQILSLNIPMVAIQIDLLQVGDDDYVLNFTKILDVYAEPEEEEEPKIVNEATWKEKAQWTLAAAKELLSLIPFEKKALKYTQSYVAITVDGKRAFSIDKRTSPASVVWFKVGDEEKAEAIKTGLDKAGITYNYNKYKEFVFSVDPNLIKNKADTFREIIAFIYREQRSAEE